MKIYLFSILLFTSAISQVNYDYLEFYPLNTGHYWEYEEVVVTYDPPMWLPNYKIGYYSLTVLGDTLLQNGHEYFILQEHHVIDESHYFEYRFERIDSLSGNVFRYNDSSENSECLVDSLKSQVGDSSRATRSYCIDETRPIMVCSKDTLEYLFGELRRIKYFECCADFIISCPEYSLIEHLGLLEISAEFDFGWYRDRLIYSDINNQRNGTSVLLSLENKAQYPAEFTLFQNYPNPFNSTTVISFHLPQTQLIVLELFDINGKKIKTLLKGILGSGSHSVTINGNNLSSGVYYYSLSSKLAKRVKKCILVK